ncbi:MAG: DUF4855 domain-containing protein [Bacteroidota bacterium]|nr:DUF4855 domain-containing protein [Bacteroidota bacterium]MDP4205296.1 DUF4855 domain-containing protein [Bacteroidota bacterium]
MNLKIIVNVLGLSIVLLFSCCTISCSQSKSDDVKPIIPPKYESTNPISDLVLIYDGGGQRLPWTTTRIRPYVYRENNGKTEWLFDGYLFLEIFDSVTDYEYYPGFNRKEAGKEQWQSLIDTYFSSQRSFDALETVLEERAQKGNVPDRKRKVVVSIPTPINGFTEWGSIDGKALDFNNVNDQVRAEQWFIDEVLKRWQEKNYKHLALAGFYWVDENSNNYTNAIALTKNYLASKGFKLHWIPYWNAIGGDKWNTLGFDYAYLQPNYFFTLSIPYQRLPDACNFASIHNMGLEMEFDGRVTQSSYRERFYSYIQAFSNSKVWDLKPVAYYEGGGAWYTMATSSDVELQKMYKKLADIIVDRQKRADERSKK